jgi:hypothetical protein
MRSLAVGVVIATLAVCASARAQPSPDPVPATPPDEPMNPPIPPPPPTGTPVPPPPAPVQVAPAPPPPPRLDAFGFVALIHALCPDRARGPGCSGGVFAGARATMILAPPEKTVGFATDFRAGFGFGFGFEGDREPNEEQSDAIGHLMVVAEGGLGPGVRIGAVEVLGTIGIGGEALTWGHTGVEDDAFAESYWYLLGAVRVRLADELVMFATGAQKFGRWIDFSNLYQRQVEAGVSFLADDKGKKSAMSVYAFYADYGGILVAGVALGGGFPEKR